MRKLKILLQSNVFYIGFFLFLLFYVFFFTNVVKYETKIPTDTKEITAKILSFTIDGDKLSLLLKGKEKISATYYIQSKEEKEKLENSLKVGQTLKLSGEEKEVIGMTIPNTFDYKKYLYHEKIYFCFQTSKLEIMDDPIGFFNTIKNKVEERIKKLGNHSYLRAFIIGDKTLIDSEQYENIMENGVSHLFALSGMHLSFLYTFLDKILKKWKCKKIVIYSFLFLYLFITGFSVSFLRAILFLVLLDINKKLGVSTSRIKVLFLTAFLLLLINPFYIYNVGFWYTFVVTFSLLFCSSLLNQKKKLLQIILVSIITFLFSFPISIYLNYEINLLSIFNNIILVPFISTFVFPLALITFVFPFFLPIFEGFVFLLEKINSCFASIAIPLIVGKINIFEIIIYYGILLLAIEFRSKKGFACLFFLVLFFYNQNLLEMQYEVYFLDVGQGDATLFVTPQNKEVILIDTGGSIAYPKKDFQKRNKEFNLGDNIVTFLKSKRIRSIDLLMITHGDKDHLGYADTIGSDIKIENVMINKDSVNEEEKKLIQKWHQVENYQSKYFAMQTFFLKLYDNENDNSVLTKLKIYNYSFLMMGDASRKVEEEFMKKYNVSSTFIKIGHHGSNTSSAFSFLKKVNPKYAVVSAGRNNRYHHPSKETIENLEKLKIPTLSTQEMGTIEIKIKENGYHIKQMLA